MKKLLIGLAFLAGVMALPAVADNAYPLHENGVKYSWAWEGDVAAPVVMAKAEIVQSDDSDDGNNLGW